MRKILPLLLVINLFAFNVMGQTDVSELFKNRMEVVFSFQIDGLTPLQLKSLSQTISIDKVVGNQVTAYANEKEFGSFLTQGISYRILTPPSMQEQPLMRDHLPTRETNDWDYYPTYDAYVAMMNQFAADFPDLCEVVNIGTSTQGRDLLFIHINDNLAQANEDPEFMYTSSMHGDELTGYVLMLRLIDHLLTNYGVDDQITNMVENIDIWINPLANPDGTFAGGNSTVYGATRSNANGVDLNRNYADPEDGPHPDGNAYQVETLAFMDFAEDRQLVMSSNLHGGAELANYPWDTWPQLHADTDWWEFTCRAYADTAHVYSPSGYLTDEDNGVTNGYAWYSTAGSRQDYMNYFHFCRELTLEISSQKTPNATQMPAFWEYNYRSLLNFMEQSMFGIAGVITDKITGEPLDAKVFMNNHDIDHSWVYSALPDGDYHRPIKAGSYNISYSAPGYFPKNYSAINLSDWNTLVLDVQLEPITELTADFTANSTIVGENSSVSFVNESFGSDIVSWNWTFEGGDPATSVLENPIGIQYNESGNYDVKLVVTDMSSGSDTQIKTGYIQVYDAFTIQDGELTTCSSLFYDTGGESGNYSDNQDYTMTLYPSESNKVIQLEFLAFNVEFEDNCSYDYLQIYNGVGTSAPLIGTYCGTTIPDIIRSTDDLGALTVHFHSDNSEVRLGWKALVSCDSNVGVVQEAAHRQLAYPNPVSDRLSINLSMASKVVLTDLTGRELFRTETKESMLIVSMQNYPKGLYFLSIISAQGNYCQKILVE